MPASNGADPIVLDMATSRVAMGKVRVAYNQGVEMLPDALIDNKGNSTNDPGVMFSEPKGALRSMGLHKGYGLAVICAAFDAEIDKFTAWVKASPPAPGVEQVMVPGDPERKSKAERLANGIPIDEMTFEELLAAGEAVGLDRSEAMRIIGN